MTDSKVTNVVLFSLVIYIITYCAINFHPMNEEIDGSGYRYLNEWKIEYVDNQEFKDIIEK